MKKVLLTIIGFIFLPLFIIFALLEEREIIIEFIFEKIICPVGYFIAICMLLALEFIGEIYE